MSVDSLFIVSDCPIDGAVRGVLFTFTLEAEGGIEPYTWSKVGGALPAGLLLRSTGVLIGKPRASGIFPVRFRVEDRDGNFGERQLLVVVDEP
jgi:Putative Ig domain